ncbi:MAG: aldo/keto reductase [Akkermansiaceae bacterium]
MNYRRCGDSGLLLPEISLGFWHNFGHIDNFQESRAIMRRAFDRGITHFDLANNYGPPAGSAEENVGRILAEDFACHRDELIITTKAGHYMWDGPYGEWGSRKHMLASLDQSLKRLRLDYVDIFYSHRPDPNTRLEESMSALATAVNSGKALYVGLSKYPLKKLKKAVRILKDMGVRCVVYQPPYSILDRWPETQGIFDYLVEKKIGCVAFSPLAQGMLTPKYCDGIPTDSRAARKEGFLTEQEVTSQQKKIRALHNIATKEEIAIHHMALKFALRPKAITSAIIGARNVKQLDDSLATMDASELSTHTLKAIDRIAPTTKKKAAKK